MKDVEICFSLAVMSFGWSLMFFARDHGCMGALMGVAAVVALAMCYKSDDE